MTKAKTIIGAIITLVLMPVCGFAAGFAAFCCLAHLGLKLQHGNLEYYFHTGGGGAFLFGSAVIGFLAPGAIVWYLYKRA